MSYDLALSPFFQGGIGLGSGLGGWIASGWGTRRSLILQALVVISSLLLIPIFAIYKKSMEVQKN
jgi:predicted MFS family arabinose efflux permease